MSCKKLILSCLLDTWNTLQIHKRIMTAIMWLRRYISPQSPIVHERKTLCFNSPQNSVWRQTASSSQVPRYKSKNRSDIQHVLKRSSFLHDVSLLQWASLHPGAFVCACRPAGRQIQLLQLQWCCYAVVCMIIDQRVMQDKAQCASVDCFAVRTAGSRIVVSLQTAKDM